MMKWDDGPRDAPYEQLKGELRERLEEHSDLSREKKRLALETLVDELVTTDAERDIMVKAAAVYLARAAYEIKRSNDTAEMQKAGEAFQKVSTWLQQHKDEIHLP